LVLHLFVILTLLKNLMNKNGLMKNFVNFVLLFHWAFCSHFTIENISYYKHLLHCEVKAVAKKNLHPSVQKFKQFVKNHPELIQEVRNGNTTWQELYEDWYLLGEDDPKWGGTRNTETTEKSAEPEKKTDWFGTIMGAVKNMDPEQLQGQINNISQALGAIQGVLSQFQGNKGGQQGSTQSGPSHPFSFRKD
jgi:hypothetical protein